MDPVSKIAFWVALFTVTHLGMTAKSVRPRLTAAIGERPYLGLYSLISFATFIPMTSAFFANKHAGALLWSVRDIAAVRLLAQALMVLALLMIAGSFITPSPAGLAPNARNEVRGVLKLTRHPLFVGIALFGLAHLLMNGWLGDVMYFASFPVVSIVGALHQDQRKQVSLGAPYGRFCEETSVFPGLALLDGRQKIAVSDISWAAVAVGLVLVVGLVAVHPALFGGRPLG